MVIAGWGLLADERWLAIPCLLEAQDNRRLAEGPGRASGGPGRAPRWLRGVFWIALGGLWDGPGRARAGARMAREAHGRCWAAHGPFGLTFSNVLGPHGAQSLRFPMILGLGRSRCTPVMPNRPRASKG